MSTRHHPHAGHAPSGFHPRLAKGFEAPTGREGPAHERLDRASAFLAAGRPGLHALLKMWDRLAGPIPTDWIRDGLRGLRVNRDDLWGCVHFDERVFQRTRIHLAGHYEALVLCWRPGQGGPIQDNGGSTCGALVVEGAATEIAYMTTPCGRLAPSRSQRVHAGAVIVSGPRDIYQIANLEPPGTHLVSLHVYSPPLAERRCYRLAETIFADHDALLDEPPTTRSAPI